ncbi:hypothetical protein [Nostoc sp. 106C]|uniref:hypothetical protein n=1 Tax=Nostoc sp. 106C TaxID=1932667 RepID=UPI001FB63C3A|nr:hypothetical protein [Nostoc sp. 106C]
MNNSNQQLTLYYPCAIQILDQFVQTISVEFWIQNPINEKWNLIPCKNGDSSISGYTYAIAPRIMVYPNEEYPSIEAFLQAKQEEGVDYPIRHKRTYLTVKGAASHKLFWAWTNPQTNKIERIHWHPLAIKAKTSEDDQTDYSNLTPVKIVNGKLITLEKDNLPSNRAAFSEFIADREENLRLALEAMKSPNPDAALELLAIMEEISKDCFYASWIMGNGYNLESILKSWDGTSNVSYGSGEITHQQLALMRVLCELSQGWWFWDEDNDTGVIFQSYPYQGIA